MHSSKECFKCLITKDMSEFYKHPAMGDGHLGKCKECTKMDAGLHRRGNLEKIRAYDVERGKLPHRKAMCIATGKRIRASPDNYLFTHARVAYALKKGTLKRMPCLMCGTTKNIHAHHDDYSKPLDVMWLCVVHHKSRHAYLDYIKKDTF